MKIKCLNCENVFKKNGSKKFCSLSCAAKFNRKKYGNPTEKPEVKEKLRQHRFRQETEKYGEYKNFEVLCYNCSKKIKIKEREKKFPTKEKYFCSRFCSNHRLHSKETKEKIRKSVLKYFECNAQTKKEILIKKKCLSCGEKIIVKTKSNYCKECSFNKKYLVLFKKLNIKKNNFKIANKKAVEVLTKEYFVNKKSLIQIRKEYGIMFNTIHFFFKKNGISLRDGSKAQRVSLEEGRYIIGNNKTYKSGYHTSWFGRKYFYRSSYEERMMNVLDERKEFYLYEKLKIKYEFNKKVKTYITDFLLPEKNLVIETKGEWFQKKDKEEIEAKKKVVLKNGYKYIMLGDKEIKEYEKGKKVL